MGYLIFKSLFVVSILFAGTQAFATPTKEQPDRNIQHYLLESNNVGLKAMDPVSYYREGGGAPLAGSSSISVNYGGVTYLFASTTNRDLFLSNPNKYEPTYGGWCAWAMANRAYADIDPKLYSFSKLVDGNAVLTDENDPDASRIHFFINRRAKASFDRRISTHEVNADDFWFVETQEAPRF